MKLKHIFLSFFVSAAYWGTAQAQSVDDALIFSQEDIGASARIKALGNAQTALGGDISAINGNPAGLGFFSRSDISLTTNYLRNNNKTYFEGANSTSQKGTLGIDQAGAVFHFPKRTGISTQPGWINFNIGLSYNKTQNFNNNLNYEGINPSSSIVHALTDIMAGSTAFETDFYNGSNIVEQYADANKGYFPLAVEDENKNQYNEVLTNGNRSKTVLAFGANYNNTFYIGANVGISTFRYNKSTQFIEGGWTKTADEVKVDNPNSIFADENNEEYDYLNANYELFDVFKQNTRGSGVDLKLGMIYKPAVDWNIGLTITTPTWTTVEDDTDIYTDVDFYDNEQATESFYAYESDIYSSSQDFRLTTPWKLSFGLSKFFSRGLLSADVEYVTYNTMKYSGIRNNVSDFDIVNQNISDTYKGAANIRVGGEYLFTNILSGRAGFNYFGNPYKGDINDKNYSGSLGLGVKFNQNWYMDLAVVHQVYEYSVAPYVVSGYWHDLGIIEPVADITHNRTNAVLTLGVRF